MKKVFLDTNVFLRFWVDQKGRRHDQCVKFFNLIETGEITPVVCSAILLEIYFTLKSFYGYDKKKCGKFLNGILTINNLKIIDNFDYPKALELFSKTGIKFTDCLIVSLPFFQKEGIIISYDKDFDKLGVKRLEPGEFLEGLARRDFI